MIVLLSLIVIVHYSQSKNFYYTLNDEKVFIEPIRNKVLVYNDTIISKESVERVCKKTSFNIKQIIWGKDSTSITLISNNEIDISKIQMNLSKYDKVCRVYRINEKEIGVLNEIVVRPKNEKVLLSQICNNNNVMKTYKKTYSNDFIITISNNSSPIEVANNLYETGCFEYAFPNFVCDFDIFNVYPNDTYFAMQYALHNVGQLFTDNHQGSYNADINAPEAWEITLGDSSIVIAVIDGGVTSNHPDLPNTRQIRLEGSNFGSGNPDDPSPMGNNAHGTCCAGTIAATINNNEGIAGIAPQCKIMPIRVDNNTITSSHIQIENAIYFAVNNNANIISMSLGYSDYYDSPNIFPNVVTAIQNAINNNVCVMIASGNWEETNSTKVAFPANCNVNYKIAVGASDRYDKRAYYSSTNPKIDIVAPSHRAYPTQISSENFEIWALDMPGYAGYNPDKGTYEILPNLGTNNLAYTGRFGGTSHATPLVAGVAALMLSVNPDLSPRDVYEILTETSAKVGGYTYTNGRCNEMGYGRVDAYAAVQEALKRHIQNKTFESGTSIVEYYPEIFAGYSVTEAIPYGNVVVKSGSNVTFKATDKIHLKPGFRVERGGNFHAYIEQPQANVMSVPILLRRNIESGEKTSKKDVNNNLETNEEFYLSPNPVNKILTINSLKDMSAIIIYTLGGQPILQTTQTEINVSSFPPGMYIVRALTTDGEQLQSKFIKQ